jgi:hypothetical protein
LVIKHYIITIPVDIPEVNEDSFVSGHSIPFYYLGNGTASMSHDIVPHLGYEPKNFDTYLGDGPVNGGTHTVLLPTT